MSSIYGIALKAIDAARARESEVNAGMGYLAGILEGIILMLPDTDINRTYLEQTAKNLHESISRMRGNEYKINKSGHMVFEDKTLKMLQDMEYENLTKGIGNSENFFGPIDESERMDIRRKRDGI